MKNPFFSIGAFPDFPNLTPAAADEALPQLLAAARARVDELEASAPATWEGYVVALDDAQRPLWEAWGIVSHLQSVCNSEAWRKVEEKYQGDIVAFSLRVGQSRRFYDLAKTLLARLPPDAATRRRILEKTIRGRSSRAWRLRAHGRRASTRSGRAREARERLPQPCAGRDEGLFAHARDAGRGRGAARPAEGDDGGHERPGEGSLAGDDRGCGLSAVHEAFAQPARARGAVPRARHARVSGIDNTPLIARILALRKELAALLGFGNYAELSLASKTAPSVAAVYAMIDALAAASRPVAARERDDLAAFAAANGFAGALEPWDVAFWSERRREKLYAYSEEELSRYFNLPVVLKGLFSLTERLFGVTVEPMERPFPCGGRTCASSACATRRAPRSRSSTSTPTRAPRRRAAARG